ncbi:oxidoreductase [Phlyctema vagabunda]|uniref:D-xylose 1-dehydrogenase (NADP(+), D-xylono-1,5-lactone-forming) n=1 Tax=Phlyctema vagabunda TaxID=108571 RepID=A0ABR4PWM0_9HELO
MSLESLPSIRWGILGTGWVSTMFVKDLVVPRENVPVKHIFQALGTSSEDRGTKFIDENAKEQQPRPTIYTNYESIYTDSEVDIVYVGVPHSLHREICLAAIAAGKHVLCEKPMTMNEKGAQEVIAAAKAKGVFLMEAVWTRFFPITKDIQRMLHEEKVLGEITRMFCDFAIPLNLPSLPAESRLKDPKLGAGALLDIGIYNIMYSNILLDGKVGTEAATPEITSNMVIVDGVDVEDVIIVKYPETQRIAILTSSLQTKTAPEFCRVEGTKGTLTLSGLGTSIPSKTILKLTGKDEEVKEYESPGLGFFHEADAVALDILAGKKESATMPLAETVRMLGVMDSIRKSCGLVYPQDQN